MEIKKKIRSNGSSIKRQKKEYVLEKSSKLEKNILRNAKSIFRSLDKEPIIFLQPRSPPMTGFFPPDKDDNFALTKSQKFQRKTPPSSSTNRQTRAIIGSNEPLF